MVAYRRFPDKALKDTYTPLVLKLQTMAMAGSLGLLPLTLIRPRLWVAVGLAWAGTLISALPFALFVARRDKAVGVVAPFIVLARSDVFALGSLHGLARSLLAKNRGRLEKATQPSDETFMRPGEAEFPFFVGTGVTPARLV